MINEECCVDAVGGIKNIYFEPYVPTKKEIKKAKREEMRRIKSLKSLLAKSKPVLFLFDHNSGLVTKIE